MEQRPRSDAPRRSRFDLLVDALSACEEIGAIARVLADAEVSKLDFRAAGRIIFRTARATESLLCDLIENEDARHARPRSTKQRKKPRHLTAVPLTTPTEEANEDKTRVHQARRLRDPDRQRPSDDHQRDHR